MQEKSILDKTENDLVGLQAIKPKDSLNEIKKKQLKEEKRKKQEEKELLVQQSIKKDKATKKIRKMVQRWSVILSPNFWVSKIQSWEDLIMVAFIDFILFSIAFSIACILYIIIQTDKFSLTELIIKLSGCIVICVIGIVIQVNINQTKSNKE